MLQTGSQQRSDARFRLACELIRNGRLGKLAEITTILPAGLNQGPFKSTAVPKDKLPPLTDEIVRETLERIRR